MHAPLPPDEAARLEALRQYGVLDTAPEPEFDDLTQLAAQICGTPLSAITLLDATRQWFKSRVGIEATETSLDASFCAHTILGRDLLIVADASIDERFADNPSVTAEPYIRFYAGMPLVTPEGHAVGSLCVVDTVPRQLNQIQQDALRRLGRLVVTLLEARPDVVSEKGLSRQARQHADQQRRTFEAELQASEERYRRLFEATQDGIVILDAESGEIQNVNPHLCQLLGYAADDLVGKRFWEIDTFCKVAADQAAFTTLHEQKFVRYDDFPLETKDGQITPVEFVCNVYTSGGKKVIQCTIHDISERKSVEAVFAHLSAIVQSSEDAIISKTLNGIITSWNAGAQKLYGYTAEEAIGRPVSFLAPSDLLDEMQQLLEKIRRGESVEHYETVRLRKDGSRVDISLSISPMKDAAGHIIGASSIKRDITERKQAEDELHKAKEELELNVFERTGELRLINEQLQSELSERRHTEEALRDAQQMLQLVMNHIPQAIFWKDRNCVYLGCNYRLALDAGFNSPDEVRGKNDLDMPWAELAEDYQGDDRLVMETDTPKLNIEEPLIRADGGSAWMLTNKIPLHDNEGAVVGVLATYEDITLQKEAESAIHQAREEADAANLAKSEFLSRMSHELRTPLNAILGFSQILDRQDLNSRAKESVGYILEGGRHLLGLINEILDIARVEAGHFDFSLESVALSDMVPEVCALVQPLADERNIGLDDSACRLSHNYMLADLQRVKQVLINLLSNAIKYNREDGQVVISCGLEREGFISIEVRDTGPGISPQDLCKLFTPFERLNAGASGIEGSGLGLVLSQRLVTAMGGTLTVQSVLGQGTIFTIELPQAESPEELLTNVPEGARSSEISKQFEHTYSVLCIEDNPSNLRLMESIFEDRPEITLMTAMQGSVGLDLARRHEPDLILLDLDLPDIHGSEVLTRLQQSALTRDIPVVVVSADATPNQIERLLTAGAKSYLTKPLDVGQFLDTVDKFLQSPLEITTQPNKDEESG